MQSGDDDQSAKRCGAHVSLTPILRMCRQMRSRQDTEGVTLSIS